MSKIVVTLSQPEQIGADEWKQVRVSRIFLTSSSIGQMMEWAKAIGIKNPQISDLIFSEYCGEEPPHD